MALGPRRKTMSEFVLTPAESSIQGGLLRQSCHIRRMGEGSKGATLWWEGPADLAPLESGDAEPYLIAMLHVAMSEGRDLRVVGKVGRRLLANLEEFVLAWNRWSPGVYRSIRIIPEQVVEEAPTTWSPKAITAFSGGVDASFTVWRHHTGRAGFASRSIVACAMVHGFDIPLDQEEKFRKSFELGKETLDGLGIELIALRSNIREEFPLEWNDHHGAALVGAMHLLKSKARTLLIGSSDPYDQLILPYGSNPLTDPLLSSGSLEVVHDGSGFDRTGKVALIADWQLGIRNLRVCWKGTQVGANCGHCEKCLRTHLNFLVNGLVPPSSLASSTGDLDFQLLDSESESVIQEFVQILEAAKANGRTGPWIEQLEKRLIWLRRRNSFRSNIRSAKNVVRSLIGRSN